jgi:hypothetical protein
MLEMKHLNKHMLQQLNYKDNGGHLFTKITIPILLHRQEDQLYLKFYQLSSFKSSVFGDHKLGIDTSSMSKTHIGIINKISLK